ncbi:hypothetical protein CDL15_Pgr026083 [Punica granatum]|uniref:ACT domain-containing protein ACR n=1 Tax=Punica granatum TaxID=22663 RepID=A0A218WCH6_PUNGR|nr:hypothetical protein CDL15_Pgr026083 [Punica granatum]
MGIVYEDAVVISNPNREGDYSTVITVNCPDKTGLGCDLCRTILLFGLSICRGDGKWCYIVFWVIGRPKARWDLLKKRLLDVCPSYLSTSDIQYYRPENKQPLRHNLFLLKFWCSYDQKGLLHVFDRRNSSGAADVTEVLCELELTIKRVKVSTTPDGSVLDLFFVTDSRELLHTRKRQEETIGRLRTVLGDSVTSCDIERAGPEVTECSEGSCYLPPAFTEDLFGSEMHDGNPNGTLVSNPILVSMDNSLSPSHTVVQILCQDHKGLIYDIMRTLKDRNIQISYGRFFANPERNCEVELFIMQRDGEKIVDPNKQEALSSLLQAELRSPLRVAVVNRGPDTELLVANPVELSRRGRPLVFYDITLALKILNTQIFSVEIARHMIRNREWEVYRIILDERDCLSVPRKKIEEAVQNKLMGWE